MGGFQNDQGKRLFASMMSEKNFKTNFDFNMDSFKEKLPGPTVEEIDRKSVV